MQALRLEYRRGQLQREMMAEEPFAQFAAWMVEAEQADLLEPNAMTLATADENGRPSARLVLLKEFDEQGFVFYTNYESRKGRELAANPWAALTFWWGSLQRQVRIEGRVERVSGEESDAYYESRPAGSRIGAWASHQSEVIEDRAELEARLVELEARFAVEEIVRPPFWGGYRVVPTAVEFWQGGVNRLHDRFRYTRQANGSWLIERLSP
ncbi:MAG: pyridoxamine 5'-phosphate oxidase [Anaerolineales bacterium]|nr:pyridoxamine 5'-phosphate oxidase [Anaerolineales bacterium]